MSDTPPLCQPPCPASTLEASFKLDEGYSEDTRSQDGSDVDVAIPIESRSLPSYTGIPEVIMNLSEHDRLGKIDF